MIPISPLRRGLVKYHGDDRGRIDRKVDRRAKLVHRQALQQCFRLVARGLQPKAVAVTGDHEVEQDLALRRQQGAGTRFIGRQRIEVGGDQSLEEIFGVLAGDGDNRAVVEANSGHRSNPARRVGTRST
ncbi:hypothetical protein D9M70_582730 [compost metagenome]